MEGQDPRSDLLREQDIVSEEDIRAMLENVEPMQAQAVNVPDAGHRSPVSPRVVIAEEPAENKLRFRYEGEGRSSGVLKGATMVPRKKIFPAIQVLGNVGSWLAVCIVSLVEHVARGNQGEYCVHPNELVGKQDRFEHGVCIMEQSGPNPKFVFRHLGIQMAKRRDKALKIAERLNAGVDPFKQGSAHAETRIDHTLVRLCFQVTLKTDEGDVPLPPVVSDVIKHQSCHNDPEIVEISDDTSPVSGGKKILVFCHKTNSNDVQVHFTQALQSGGECLFAIVLPDLVHKLHGISFKTPPCPMSPSNTSPYPLTLANAAGPIRCSLYLYKPSTGAYSEPVDFTYYVPDSTTSQSMETTADLTQGSSVSFMLQDMRQRRNRKRSDENFSGQPAIPAKCSSPQSRCGSNSNLEFSAAPELPVLQFQLFDEPERHQHSRHPVVNEAAPSNPLTSNTAEELSLRDLEDDSFMLFNQDIVTDSGSSRDKIADNPHYQAGEPVAETALDALMTLASASIDTPSAEPSATNYNVAIIDAMLNIGAAIDLDGAAANFLDVDHDLAGLATASKETSDETSNPGTPTTKLSKDLDRLDFGDE